MKRATRRFLTGVGLTGVATVVARRVRSGTADGTDDGASGRSVVTSTIGRPVDEVARAWAAGHQDDERPVEVDFSPAPGGRGTEVRARFGPAVSGAGAGVGLVTRIRGQAPVQQQREKLRRFKALVECGEVVAAEGQPSGRGPVQAALTRAVTRRLRAWGAP
jgi:hypothetical protein